MEILEEQDGLGSITGVSAAVSGDMAIVDQQTWQHDFRREEAELDGFVHHVTSAAGAPKGLMLPVGPISVHGNEHTATHISLSDLRARSPEPVVAPHSPTAAAHLASGGVVVVPSPTRDSYSERTDSAVTSNGGGYHRGSDHEPEPDSESDNNDDGEAAAAALHASDADDDDRISVGGGAFAAARHLLDHEADDGMF
jgi:hypothetical protein